MISSVAIRSYSSEPQLHSHSFHQIVLPRQGALELEVAGLGGRVDQTRGAFIPAGEIHIFSSHAKNKFIVVDVADDDLQLMLQCETAADRLDASIYFPIKPTVRTLLQYLAGINLPAVEKTTQAWLTLLLLDFIDASICYHAGPPRALAEALTYIEQHLAEAISVADIACAAMVSERRLHTLFRSELGSAPHSYVIERRLNFALDLLAATLLPVSQIALLTGHSDQSALTRRLKKQHGITPAAYRRSCCRKAAAETDK